MDQAFQWRLRDALLRVPIVTTPEGRDALLEGIPRELTRSFYRYRDNIHNDLNKLIEQLDQLGRLEKSGEHPLHIFLENARTMVEGTLAGRILHDLIVELDQRDEGDIVPSSTSVSLLPETPEALIFGGSDERLPYIFFEKAIQAQKSIVRLRVPRIFHGHPTNSYGLGTGWLVTPQLVLTNYHVIHARTEQEGAADPIDFRTQAEQTIAWFDYHIEEGKHQEWPCAELLAHNKNIDYALLRLTKTTKHLYRPSLHLAHAEVLKKAARLNIVQHPGGRLLCYAIRNNFYIGPGNTAQFLRYLTDTEPGASGSPIFNDDWLVVGLHRAAVPVSPASYKGETIKYHNEGIEIHAILDDLPENLRQEIFRAQGW